jgi:glucose-1-phosphate thymidylyltransferase
MIPEKEWIGLIPAAGKGVRLSLPYPKELYPIIRDNHYKPVSQFVLDNLTSARVGHVVFVINETKHQLMGYFGDGHRFGCNISYVFQEPNENQGGSTSPGLAHALDAAYHLTRDRRVFFGMADTIMQPGDVFRVLNNSSDSSEDVILGLFPTQKPEKFGMVQYDKQGKVQKIVDKPRKTSLTHMWGCMIWSPAFTEFLHHSIPGSIYDFAQIMNAAITVGFHFRGIPLVNSNDIDLGTYEEIMEMDRQFREE